MDKPTVRLRAKIVSMLEVWDCDLGLRLRGEILRVDNSTVPSGQCGAQDNSTVLIGQCGAQVLV